MVFITVSIQSSAQSRKVTTWGYGVDEVILVHTFKDEQLWLARRGYMLKNPKMIRALDGSNYVLFPNGTWETKKQLEEQLKITLRHGSDTLAIQLGQILPTLENDVDIIIESEVPIAPVTLVVTRRPLAIRQMYPPYVQESPITRDRVKSSATFDLEKGQPEVIMAPLTMCSNEVSLYLPGGELLFEFMLYRKLPDEYFPAEDTTMTRGILVESIQRRGGEPINLYRRVYGRTIFYSIENLNSFDVELTISFGAEYTVEFPLSMGKEILQHPPSMPTAYGNTRVRKVVLKAGERLGSFKATLNACEFASQPFQLNVSSVRPLSPPIEKEPEE